MGKSKHYLLIKIHFGSTRILFCCAFLFEVMLHQRKDYRLKTYDYSSPGSYFITVCVKNRESILWKNVGARIARPQFEDNLSRYGITVAEAISNLNKFYPMVEVNKYTIMPDHLHMILTIKAQQPEQEQGRTMRAPTVATVINQMKGYVTKNPDFHFGKNYIMIILFVMKKSIA